MNWDPDSGDALTSPPITVSDVEKTSNRIWAEFLKGWFNGETHQLRGTEVQLPLIPEANITFQENIIENPKDGLYLQLTLEEGESKKRYLHDEWRVYHDVCVHFYFRAQVKEPRADGHNSRSLVRWGSDTLYAILLSSQHCTVLNWYGMMMFRPQPPGLVTGSLSYPMRELVLNCRYVYPADENISNPIVGSNQAGSIVYLGRDQEVRVTPDGLEVKGEDGNWYRIGSVKVDSVPTLTVTEQA